ncbi:hypothetical protein BDV36DRAFT_249137 [Aspergillus pseudocaelatus]|uniref:Uncharacterized protein n=1 Tax=Aspergillus pseudocaelatus TaxID=1825620 RepID=A0ABQ6WUK0_9EURO|nr:hypothetical protein BDV36DRAFT_249137 [Aspergillus pseudocaelatus]
MCAITRLPVASMSAPHAMWPFPAGISCGDICKSTSDPRTPPVRQAVAMKHRGQLRDNVVTQPVSPVEKPE